MNTTTAATEAKVTVATIRTWCRIGAVAAAKVAGKWVIDTTSLAARIAIGARRLARKAKMVVFTVDNMIAIGGRRWQKAGKDRVYINNWAQFIGLETSAYGSGNISSAHLGGRAIANGRVGRLLDAIDRVYFDAADGRVWACYASDARAFSVRYLSGERETVDLKELMLAGMRAAIAAL